ncbi:type IV pilus biogenesis/stability protein PilW [Marinicella sediminis]|uniref:Type IV pilus biogenesis/stability protein PilW n=1 Tax=Marinicella sediminis TaxID=1792834 RepID=A0ABV7JFW5_9GAMM|nr:type IV pilus biogenesis/stability protein PilW [Marinicella sediminis]
MKRYRWIWLMCVLCVLAGCAQTSQPRRYQESDSQQEPENSPAMLNVKMGVAYLEREDYRTALEKLKRALAHNPKLAIAHSAIALVYTSMNAQKDAERHYELSVKYAPNDPNILNNYGTYLCQNGQYLEAVGYYKKTLANPFYRTPETVHENIGVCLMKADQQAEAEYHFRKALEANPNMIISIYNMVIVSAGKGESMRARAFIQRLESLTELDEKVLKVAYEVEKKMGNDRLANEYLVQLRKLKKS